MIIDCKRGNSKVPFVLIVQLLALAVMGFVEFLVMTKGYPIPVNWGTLTNAGIALSLLAIWAITILKNPRAVFQRNVIWGIVMVLWFLIVEMNRRINYIPFQSLTVFAAVYLIAFPFASLAQDHERQAGIRIVSGFYIAAALLLMVLGLFLLLGGTFSGQLSGRVYWDGARLLVISHPNITSRIFMIALALCMGFFGESRKAWRKAVFLLVALLLLAGIALTNTRAVIIVICFIIAGNAFFLVFKNNRKRFIPGVLAAILAAVLVFTSSSALFEWNTERLTVQASMQTVQAESADAAQIEDEEASQDNQLKGNSNSGQQPLLTDLPTLNNRTTIWAAFLQKIQNEPAILLRGAVDSRLVLVNLHTHNAWLEALIVLGLPGLLLVLMFSWNATWSSLRLLWSCSTGMFQKNIALLALAMMVAALLEPCLFVTYLEWSFSDFFFFLCLGYLTLWSKQIAKTK